MDIEVKHPDFKKARNRKIEKLENYASRLSYIITGLSARGTMETAYVSKYIETVKDIEIQKAYMEIEG